MAVSSYLFKFEQTSNMTIEQQFIDNEKQIKTYLFHKTGGDKELADDFYQEMYFKIRKIADTGKYVEEGKFLYWAKTIASNMVIDFFRASKKKPKISNDKFKEAQILKGGTGPIDLWDYFNQVEDEEYQDTFVSKEMSEKLKKAVSELSQAQKDLISMRYYRNMSYKEIVLETGEKQSNLLPRHHYAMKKLKGKLDYE